LKARRSERQLNVKAMINLKLVLVLLLAVSVLTGSHFALRASDLEKENMIQDQILSGSIKYYAASVATFLNGSLDEYRNGNYKSALEQLAHAASGMEELDYFLRNSQGSFSEVYLKTHEMVAIAYNLLPSVSDSIYNGNATEAQLSLLSNCSEVASYLSENIVLLESGRYTVTNVEGVNAKMGSVAELYWQYSQLA